MKLAITGASGFLGKHVCRKAMHEGIDFKAFHHSNPVQFSGPSAPLNLLDIPENTFRYLEEPDVLVHLAWGGLPNYLDKYHLEVELPRQFSFLKKAIEQGLETLVVTGTCFEYGMQEGVLSEDMSAHPDNPYGKAKLQLLNRLLELQKSHPFNLVWGRLFYMYGHGQSSTSLWPQFQAAVDRKETIFKMSGGQQVRDFSKVEEVAALIVELCKLRRDIGVINICSGQPTTVEALVRQWAKKAGWNGELELGYYPYPTYEPMSFWGDRGKLNSVLAK